MDVGAHRLHLHCAGASSPTVPFEAGGGNGSVTFRPLMRVLAGETRVCAYDRAGCGYSSPVQAERDAQPALAAQAPSGRVIAIDGDHYLPLEHTDRFTGAITALVVHLRR